MPHTATCPLVTQAFGCGISGSIALVLGYTGWSCTVATLLMCGWTGLPLHKGWPGGLCQGCQWGGDCFKHCQFGRPHVGAAASCATTPTAPCCKWMPGRPAGSYQCPVGPCWALQQLSLCWACTVALAADLKQAPVRGVAPVWKGCILAAGRLALMPRWLPIYWQPPCSKPGPSSSVTSVCMFMLGPGQILNAPPVQPLVQGQMHMQALHLRGRAWPVECSHSPFSNASAYQGSRTTAFQHQIMSLSIILFNCSCPCGIST